MKKYARFFLFLIACAANVLFYYFCGYWSQGKISLTPKLDLVCGIIAVIILGLIESRFLLQLMLRSRFSAAKKRIFDIRIWIQAGLLLLYYVACVTLTRSIEFNYGVMYLSLFAGVLAVLWLGFIKGGRVLWTGESGSYFLDEDGKFYPVIKVTESETQVFIECMVNELRSKTVVINKKF